MNTLTCLNISYFIALQCGVASIAWGGPGEGKNAMLEAVAKALGMKFYCFIPSQHAPEDLGGLPHANLSRKLVEMLPMEFILALTEPNWFFMLDELTTTASAMKAVLLSALNEGKIGSLTFHPTTIRAGAANPPEFAPNGSPLEPALLNRCYHHKWALPFDSWYAGMQKGGQFEAPSNIPIVGDFSAYVPKWTVLISNLLKAQPSLRKEMKLAEDAFGYCSLRSWHNLSVCLAGADKVGAEDDVKMELATGMVGEGGATELSRYVDALELYDPDEALDGKVVIDMTGDRGDVLSCLPPALLSAAAQNPTDKRLNKLSEILVTMAENDLAELSVPSLAQITELFPNYEIPMSLLTRYSRIVSQLEG
jgi:hypothetical protein